MSGGEVAGWVIAAGGVIVLGVITSLVTQEATGWLDKVPSWLLRLARRRLPLSSRDTLYDEWAAELHAALHGMDSRPLSRLVLGIRYAAGLLRTARRIARELGPARDFSYRAETTAADRLVVSSLDLPQADVGKQLGKDALEAWSLALNCLLYEKDKGPKQLNVGTARHPMMVPRDQAWQQAYATFALVCMDGDHARLKAAARQSLADIPVKPHWAPQLSRAADLCEQAALMVENAGAVHDDKARRRLVAICEHETWNLTLGPFAPNVSSIKELRRTLREIDREP
jgi:hypothetical protein